MIAFVFFVIFLIIVFEDRLPEDRSTSAKTGFAPQFTTEVAEATKDRGVTITSSPFFKSRLFKAKSKATDPFETAIAYLTPTHFENSASNNLPSFPVQ